MDEKERCGCHVDLFEAAKRKYVFSHKGVVAKVINTWKHKFYLNQDCRRKELKAIKYEWIKKTADHFAMWKRLLRHVQWIKVFRV
jgi:hypothetical protein